MKRYLLWTTGLLVLLAGGAGSTRWLFRRTVQVGELTATQQRVSLEQVDHSAYDALLQKYVDEEGLVAYARWKANAEDQRALDHYLGQLGAVELSRPASKHALLAFWINAYNALTIKGILREYPTSSIRKHTPLVGYNIWKDLLLTVGGQPYSLDDMEHRILRKQGEPRIHFALVCASRGCPPLRNHVYEAGSLDEQLSANARRFFARTDNFEADEDSKVVNISELLKWYGTDFAPTPLEQLRKLRPYFPAPEKLAWLEGNDVTVQYLPYDWGLNDQQPIP